MMKPPPITNAKYETAMCGTRQFQPKHHALWSLVILLSVALPTLAHAALPPCWFSNDANGYSAINAPPVQVVTINPINITFNNNWGAGHVIGTYGATTSTGTIYITCNTDTGEGLVPLYGTYSQPNNQIFAPAPGVAFQILRSGNPLILYPNYTIPGRATTSFTNNTTFKLYYTGVLPSNGNQIPAGTLLGTWNVVSICTNNPVLSNGSLSSCGTSASNYTFMQFVSGGVTYKASTCDVTSGDLVATLPPVSTSSLGAVGTTIGTTPIPPITFGNCKSNNLDVGVTINVPSTNIWNAPSSGVILPSGGSAAGVGIQVLQPDESTPVTFNSPFPTGITTHKNSTFTIQLFARYYHTSDPLSAGTVQATATYNLTYQ